MEADARVEIRVRDDGPYKVTGPVRLVDAEGEEIANPDPDRPIVLCRCGQSRSKPFCDAAHKASGFTSCVRAKGLAPGARLSGENSQAQQARGAQAPPAPSRAGGESRGR